MESQRSKQEQQLSSSVRTGNLPNKLALAWQSKTRGHCALHRIKDCEVLSAGSMQVASVPRTLVIAAHPDDETIGAGVLISRSKAIQVVHATAGSPASPSDAFTAGFSSP